MAESRIRYQNVSVDDDYADVTTHYRIWKDDGEWFLDAVDDSSGRYSEMCWSYDSWQEAIDDLPTFRKECPLG